MLLLVLSLHFLLLILFGDYHNFHELYIFCLFSLFVCLFSLFVYIVSLVGYQFFRIFIRMMHLAFLFLYHLCFPYLYLHFLYMLLFVCRGFIFLMLLLLKGFFKLLKLILSLLDLFFLQLFVLSLCCMSQDHYFQIIVLLILV